MATLCTSCLGRVRKEWERERAIKLRLGVLFGRVEGQTQNDSDDDADGYSGIGTDVGVLLHRVGRVIWHPCTSQVKLSSPCLFAFSGRLSSSEEIPRPPPPLWLR
jgi:hypothetical protein